MTENTAAGRKYGYVRVSSRGQMNIPDVFPSPVRSEEIMIPDESKSLICSLNYIAFGALRKGAMP